MDPLKSDKKPRHDVSSGEPTKDYSGAVPKRTLTTEFFVGIFTLVGVVCAGWLAIGLGGVRMLNTNSYVLYAEFDNISGLKNGASVEIAGVPIGEVTGIVLKKTKAIITMDIDNGIVFHDDDIAAIRTKGIIGDRYVKISPGGSSITLNAGQTMQETESVVDIEDIIGKIVHSLSGDKDPEDAKAKEKEK